MLNEVFVFNVSSRNKKKIADDSGFTREEIEGRLFSFSCCQEKVEMVPFRWNRVFHRSMNCDHFFMSKQNNNICVGSQRHFHFWSSGNSLCSPPAEEVWNPEIPKANQAASYGVRLIITCCRPGRVGRKSTEQRSSPVATETPSRDHAVDA